MKKLICNSLGSTLIDMLVGMAMFGVVGAGLTSVMGGTFQSVGRENRLAIGSENIRMAFSLMNSELRMASNVSPYLPGVDPTLADCSNQFQVTTSSVLFYVAPDQHYGSYGVSPVYVGYQYDPLTKKLYRGEIYLSSTPQCGAAFGDPLNPLYRSVMAENVIAIDYNGDGVNEPVFQYANQNLVITLGTQVTVEGGRTMVSKMQTTIRVRNT